MIDVKQGEGQRFAYESRAEPSEIDADYEVDSNDSCDTGDAEDTL